MLIFYRNSAIGFIVLVTLTAFLLYGGVAKSRISTPLYPEKSGKFPWASVVEPSAPEDDTQLRVKSDVGTIDYEFLLDPETQFPYSHYAFEFIEPEQPYRMVDLTEYDSVSFKMLCDPKNVLLFVLFSYDDAVTNPLKSDTRRVSSTALSCNTRWRVVTIDFDDLVTPHWWLERYGFELSDRDYDLDKTMGFALVNSLQSPVDTLSRVRLTDVKLLGHKPAHIYAALGASAVLWLVFVFWMMRQYGVALTETLREKIRQDQPLMAYKKLSIEPQKDKEKSALLRYIATEYANSDMSLDSTAAELGINRNKVNEILKEELGFTFTAYLKKLRLTEAARLLSENSGVSVSQIAYLVGYNSVSYFNKLFKTEYGCTPRTFQNLCRSKRN